MRVRVGAWVLVRGAVWAWAWATVRSWTRG